LEIESAAQELVEGGIEILLGGFEVAGLIVILTGLVFLFDAWRSGRLRDRRKGALVCGFDWGLAGAATGFCWGGSGGLLAATKAGAWAWVGGRKEVFWAL
jgi:hypothetical protein